MTLFISICIVLLCVSTTHSQLIASGREHSLAISNSGVVSWPTTTNLDPGLDFVQVHASWHIPGDTGLLSNGTLLDANDVSHFYAPKFPHDFFTGWFSTYIKTLSVLSNGSLICTGLRCIPIPLLVNHSNNNFYMGAASDYYTCAIQSVESDSYMHCWAANGDVIPFNKQGESDTTKYRWVVTTAQSSVDDIAYYALNEYGYLKSWYWAKRRDEIPSDQFIQITAGRNFICGILFDHRIMCWGRPEPPTPPTGTFVQMVLTAEDIICAVRTNLRISCFGGTTEDQNIVPAEKLAMIFGTPSPNVETFSGIRLGDNAWMDWGNNPHSQLPDGQFSYVAISDKYSCGISTNGTLICLQTLWPNEQALFAGKLFISVAVNGIDICAIQTDYVLVCTNIPSNLNGIRATKIVANYQGFCALLYPFGNVTCFNSDNGFITDQPKGIDYTDIACGYSKCCVANSTGHVNYCWGLSTTGPPHIKIRQMCSGSFNFAGITSDGDTICWEGNCGLVGITTPIRLNWTNIACVGNTVCGFGNDHIVKCYGENTYGQKNVPPVSVSSKLVAPIGYYRTGRVLRKCPDGTYSAYRGHVTPFCSGLCESGYFGSGAQTSSKCSGPCPMGYYCPSGSTSPYGCPPGYYGYYEKSTSAFCSGKCQKGTYCPDNGTTSPLDCQPGTYNGYTGQIKCPGVAEAGYWTNIGSTTGTQFTCGSPAFYCPRGSGSPKDSPQGTYTVNFDGTDTGDGKTRTDYKICPAGYSCSFGIRSICPRGLYSNQTGLSICSLCSAGHYSNTPGLINGTCSGECDPGYWCSSGSISSKQNECGSRSFFCSKGSETPQLASPGYYTIDIDGSDNSATTNTRVAQILCPAGYFCASGTKFQCQFGYVSTATGQSTCTACQVGTYSNALGQSKCLECSPGYYTSTIGSDQCQKCSSITYQNATGMSTCKECPRGFAPNDYRTQCSICPPSTYSSNGQVCLTCGINSASTSNGSTECKACTDSGIICNQGSITVKNGYWLIPGQMITAQCLEGMCTGGASGSGCSAGRDPVSPLCGRCLPDHSSWGSATCTPCKSANGGLIFLIILLMVIYVLFIHCTSQSGEIKTIPNNQNNTADENNPTPKDSSIQSNVSAMAGFSGIGFYFIQTAVLQIGSVTPAISWISFINLSPEQSTGQCPFPASPMTQIAIKIFIPGMAFIILGIIIGIHYSINYYYRKSFEISIYVRTVVALLLFMYTNVAQNVFSFLNCIDVGSSRVMMTEPAIDCTSGDYLAWRGFVIFLFITVVVGMPVAITIFLKLSQKKIQPGITDPDVYFYQLYGPLFEAYKPRFYLWGVIILIRRACFVAGTLFQDPSTRALSFALLNIIALCLQFAMGPFNHPIMNKIETLSMVLLLCISCLMIKWPHSDTTEVQVVLFFLVVVPFIAFVVSFGAVKIFNYYQKRMKIPEKTVKTVPPETKIEVAPETSTPDDPKVEMSTMPVEIRQSNSERKDSDPETPTS